MANVLLLRAPSQGQDDRYEASFSKAGYHALSVPVLGTISTNLPVLKEIVEIGPLRDNFEGVILTSARSCEAWKIVMGDLVGSSAAPTEDGWSSVPFYVVGPGTASALAEVHQTYGQTVNTPEIIRGQTSGTGERLAQFIRNSPKGHPRSFYISLGIRTRIPSHPSLRRQASNFSP